MIRTNFLKLIPLALVLTLALGLVTTSPAFAASGQVGIGPFCAGNNITVPSGQTLDALVSFGCNVTVEQGATIRNDVLDFGGNIEIAGTVGASVTTFGGNIHLAETAVVNGEFNSIGGNIRSDAGAVVSGGIRRNGGSITPPVPPVAPVAPLAPPSPFARSFDWGFNILGGIVTALAFAAIGALIVIFAPEPTRRIGDAVQAKPLNVAGVGCLTLIVLPILSLLLIITLIGIPVAFILGIAAFIAWLLGWVALGYLTGEKILQAFKARQVLPVVAVVLGVLILTLISQINIIGWLVTLVGGLLGIGAVVLTRFGTRPYPVPPTMYMTPVVAAAAPSAPGTYTPSNVDLVAWENKARQAQSQSDVPPPAAGTPPTSEPPQTSSDAGSTTTDTPPPA